MKGSDVINDLKRVRCMWLCARPQSSKVFVYQVVSFCCEVEVNPDSFVVVFRPVVKVPARVESFVGCNVLV